MLWAKCVYAGETGKRGVDRSNPLLESVVRAEMVPISLSSTLVLLAEGAVRGGGEEERKPGKQKESRGGPGARKAHRLKGGQPRRSAVGAGWEHPPAWAGTQALLRMCSSAYVTKLFCPGFFSPEVGVNSSTDLEGLGELKK